MMPLTILCAGCGLSMTFDPDGEASMCPSCDEQSMQQKQGPAERGKCAACRATISSRVTPAGWELRICAYCGHTEVTKPTTTEITNEVENAF